MWTEAQQCDVDDSNKELRMDSEYNNEQTDQVHEEVYNTSDLSDNNNEMEVGQEQENYEEPVEEKEAVEESANEGKEDIQPMEMEVEVDVEKSNELPIVEGEREGTIAQVNKGRRAASAAATQKMTELRSLSFGLRDPEAKIKRRAEIVPRKRMRRLPKASSDVCGVEIVGKTGNTGGGSMMASVDKWKPGVGCGEEEDGKGLKVSKSRLGDREWQDALWGEERVQAVTKAIDRVYDMSLTGNNFSVFGNDMIQCFYDVATVTGEPIRSKTLKYVEHLANRWKYTVMQEGWKRAARPEPSEVIEVVTGMYCMERVGIRHDLKEEVLAFLGSEHTYTAKEYFGWDPVGRVGLPRHGGWEVISEAVVSRYRLFSSSLIHAFYADRVGLTLGCPFVEIFQWLPTLRPYKGPADMSWQDYVDQCYLVTHVVFTANNWGELRLSPSLMPHEYLFLRHHLHVHIFLRDVHLIAEFVESLRCFGCTDDDPLVREGMRALLDSQTPLGIWDDTKNANPYRTYHATMCGAQALLAHKFRGFGPGIPAILPLLTRWAEVDIDGGSETSAVAARSGRRVEAVARRHHLVRERREQEFSEIPLCLSPLDYVKHFGSEVALARWKGSLDYPVDMSAHVDERLSTLKVAIRGFAKKYASSPSPISKSHQKAAADSATAPPSFVGLSAEDVQCLIRLNGLVTTYLSHSQRGTVPDNEESDLLLQALIKAEHIPVTTVVLQSDTFGSLAKQIRQVSKAAKGGVLMALSDKAGAVVSQWKQSILSTSTTGGTEGSRVDESIAN